MKKKSEGEKMKCSFLCALIIGNLLSIFFSLFTLLEIREFSLARGDKALYLALSAFISAISTYEVSLQYVKKSLEWIITTTKFIRNSPSLLCFNHNSWQILTRVRVFNKDGDPASFGRKGSYPDELIAWRLRSSTHYLRK